MPWIRTRGLTDFEDWNRIKNKSVSKDSSQSSITTFCIIVGDFRHDAKCFVFLAREKYKIKNIYSCSSGLENSLQALQFLSLFLYKWVSGAWLASCFNRMFIGIMIEAFEAPVSSSVCLGSLLS